MTRNQPARVISPLTVTTTPARRALVDAYCLRNELSLTAVVEAALDAHLGVVGPGGRPVPAPVDGRCLTAPSPAVVRACLAAEEERAERLHAAKRDRQRAAYTPAVAR
jgi:hypothetical protein